MMCDHGFIGACAECDGSGQVLPVCAVCGETFDHGCNTGVCSEACEMAADRYSTGDDGPTLN